MSDGHFGGEHPRLAWTIITRQSEVCSPRAAKENAAGPFLDNPS